MAETLEVEEPQQMLVNVSELNLAALFGEGKTEDVLNYIREQVEPILKTVPDVSSEKGRREIKSAAYKVTRSKTALDEAGKQFVADLKKQVKTVDASRKTLRDELDALRDEVRGPVDRWEEEQARRAEQIATCINAIVQLGQTTGTPEQVRTAIDAVKGTDITAETFGDKQGDAAIQKDIALSNLDRALKKAEQDAADAAELEKLRKEKEKREQQERLRAREQAAAEQAAATARAAQEKAEREAQEQRERAERAEKEAAEAEKRAQERAAAEKARKKAEDDARAADKEHRRSVNNKAAEAITQWTDLSIVEARKVVTTIAAGQIPHIKVEY